MATMTIPEIEIHSAGLDLAQKAVCIKVRLQRLGNTRKVSTSQVEVDTDKALIRVSKHLIDSAELRQITNFDAEDRKSTRLNSSHVSISYAVFCLKKKN